MDQVNQQQVRPEGVRFVRGFLVGAAMSAPFWVIVAGVLATVRAFQ